MQALWMLVASLCFATMGALIKFTAHKASLADIVLFRGAVPMLVLGTWALCKGHRLKSPVAHLHFQRSGFGIVAMWLGFYATTQLPLATATTLMYTSPLFIALLMRFVLGQRGNAFQTACIALGFGGVMLVLQPVLSGNQLPVALVGLCGGAVSALAYMQLRKLGKVAEPEWRTVFYFGITATGSALVVEIAQGHMPVWVQQPGFALLAGLLGLGLFGGAGNLALTRSFGSGSTWLSATLQYTTILFSSLYGMLWFDQHPSPATWAGMGLIMACGVASAMGARKSSLADSG